MRPIGDLSPGVARDLIGLFTDIDDTLTTHGRLPASAYRALEDLAGFEVTPSRTMNAGRMATIARNTEPVSVIFVRMLSIKSDVFLPGRIPGMNPPCFCIVSATSFGLKATAV